MPFLNSLTHTGTRVGGLRERRTQHFESSMPSFPEDYPTTDPHREYVSDRGKEERERWERTPPAKRCNYEKLGTKNPWVPDWEELLGLEGSQTSDEEALETELIPAQPNPDEIGMDVDANQEMEEMEQESEIKLRPWLLRGPSGLEILHAAASTEDDSTAAATVLAAIDSLCRASNLRPCGVPASDLFRSALVMVKILVCGRGSPDDMALIYELDVAEEEKWRAALERKKKGKAKVLMQEEGVEDDIQVRDF